MNVWLSVMEPFLGYGGTENTREFGMERFPDHAPQSSVYPPVLAHIQIVIEALLLQQ